MDTMLWKLALIWPLYLLPWLVVFAPWSSNGLNARQWRRQRRNEMRSNRASHASGHHASH